MSLLLFLNGFSPGHLAGQWLAGVLNSGVEVMELIRAGVLRGFSALSSAQQIFKSWIQGTTKQSYSTLSYYSYGRVVKSSKYKAKSVQAKQKNSHPR